MTTTKCTCPGCNSTNCCKKGFQNDGTQRYICKNCNRIFIDRERKNGIPKWKRELVLKMYLERNGFRRIGRILEISYVSAYNIVREAGLKLGGLAMDNKLVPIVEIDEIHHWKLQKKTTYGVGSQSTAKRKNLSHS